MSRLSNIALIRKAGEAIKNGELDAAADAFVESVVWHYFNPRLPELEKEYVGLLGLKTLFASLAERTAGTFTVEPVSLTPVGSELVVTQVRINLNLSGSEIQTDAVLVWRIMHGKIAEVWDIPAAQNAGEETQPTAVNRRLSANRTGARAIGALAVGAAAVGALAVGALAIGRLAIGHARIRRLEIDELVVKSVGKR